MKTIFGKVFPVLLVAAFFVQTIVAIKKYNNARQKMLNDCLYSPSWETCKPCADLPQRDMDVCRFVLASIVAKGTK